MLLFVVVCILLIMLLFSLSDGHNSPVFQAQFKNSCYVWVDDPSV